MCSNNIELLIRSSLRELHAAGVSGPGAAPPPGAAHHWRQGRTHRLCFSSPTDLAGWSGASQRLHLAGGTAPTW
jgi:hypothetical protein